MLDIKIAKSGLEMSVLSVFRPNLALADEVMEKMIELGTCWSFTKENKIVNFYIEGGMPLICMLDEKS